MQSNIQIQKTGVRDIGRIHGPLPASDLERSKAVLFLMGVSKEALHCSSQTATVDA